MTFAESLAKKYPGFTECKAKASLLCFDYENFEKGTIYHFHDKSYIIFYLKPVKPAAGQVGINANTFFPGVK